MSYDPPKHILLRRQTEAIADRDLGFLEAALRDQLQEVADLYGLPAPGVTVVTPDTFLPGTEAVAIDFVDDDGLPGGIAHHGWNPGANFAWCLVGCKEAGRLWTVAASHEALEYLVNMRLDRWRAPEDESAYWAMEICDPVEEDTYPVVVERFGETREVRLSNYVCPSFWQDDSRGPWDKLGRLTGPFSLSEGGYAIVEPADGRRIGLGGGALRGSSATQRATSRAAFLLAQRRA